MLFKNYVKNLQDLLDANPETGDYEVVVGSQGEFCNTQYEGVSHLPSVGVFDCTGFEVYCPDDGDAPPEDQLNAVKVN